MVGERFTIRAATDGDAQAVCEIYRPLVERTPISFETVPPSVDEICKRIAFTTATLPWLIADRDETVVGYAYASAHRARAAYRWSVDTSVYVDDSSHRQGVGRLLYTALIERLTARGYVNAFAGITLPNPASVGLHESVGFAPVGVFRSVGFKLDAWHDVGWWGLQLNEPPAQPGEPQVIIG
jgi:L-amino acid N-acyltransferase YncA